MSWRWGLDTCGCAFNVEVDAAGQAQLINVLGVCQVHRGLGGAELFATATEENYRRMRVLILAQKYQPELVVSDMSYQYTSARVLEVWPPLTPEEKATLSSDCDSGIGPGKVIVH